MKPDQPRHSATDPALTEVVNLRTGTVRVTGDLTRAGARSLCGTVWGLRQEGHERVVLDLGGIGRAHDEGRAVLDDLLERVTNAGGELHVLWGSHSS